MTQTILKLQLYQGHVSAKEQSPYHRHRYALSIIDIYRTANSVDLILSRYYLHIEKFTYNYVRLEYIQSKATPLGQ